MFTPGPILGIVVPCSLESIIHANRLIYSGTLSVDDELYKDLDGPLFATLTAPKSECSKYVSSVLHI